MKGFRLFRALGLALTAATIAACSDQGMSTAPEKTMNLRDLVFSKGESKNGELEQAVKWAKKPGEKSVTAVIGPDGGQIELEEAELTLSFPAGALESDVAITITSVKGDYVAYDMLPHGLVFNQPVLVSQGLRETKLWDAKHVEAKKASGIYVPSDAVPNDLDLVPVLESLPSATLFIHDQKGKPKAAFQFWQINHFSRYMLASG